MDLNNPMSKHQASDQAATPRVPWKKENSVGKALWTEKNRQSFNKEEEWHGGLSRVEKSCLRESGRTFV